MLEAYFFSDLHLEEDGDLKSKRFVEILETIHPTATHLFLLGDIFDFWASNHEYFLNRHRQVIKSLEKFKNIECYYFEGNHDIHLKSFWESRGFQVFPEPEVVLLNHLKVRLEHGDYFNPKDQTYLKWREFIRGPFMTHLCHNLPGKVVNFIGETLSKQSKKRHKEYSSVQVEDIRQKMHIYNREIFNENPELDFLIYGHTHVKDVFKFKGPLKNQQAFNLGSWYQEPKYLKLTDSSNEFICS